MKTLIIPCLGTILGCSPQSFDVDEVTASQSLALQIEDVTGGTAFQRTRPSFGAYAERSAIRLSNGRVLVVGGVDSLLTEYTNRAEVFDPDTETWAEVPPMNHESSGGKMFLLADGRVVTLGGVPGFPKIPEVFDPKSEKWTEGEPLPLIAGPGEPPAVLLDNGNLLVAAGHPDPTAYFFDTTTLTWSPAPLPSYSHYYHTMTVLQDGRVLLAGGRGIDPVSMLDAPQLITEIFDPTTNQWSDGPKMNAPHNVPRTSLLDNGRVLLVDVETAQCETFNPIDGAGGTWTPCPSYGTSLRLFSTLASLQDGRRILLGGDAKEGEQVPSFVFVPDPKNDKWLPVGNLRTARMNTTATLLKDGRLLVAGGRSTDVGSFGRALSAAELFVPNELSVWKSLGQQPNQLGQHTSTRLNDGRVLLAGFSGNLKDSFLFSPDTDKIIPTASLTNPHLAAGAVLLEDGRVMVAGGASDSMNAAKTAVSSVEFYDPKTEQWSVGPEMNQPHYPVFMTRLADGRVIAGTRSNNGSSSPSVEIFDPALGTWSLLEQPLQEKVSYADAVILRNDSVLLSGFKTEGGDGFLQVLDLKKKNVETIAMPDFYPFGRTDFLMLPDGRVLIKSSLLGSTTARMGFFEPKRKTWRLLGLVPLGAGPANLLHEKVFWAAGNSPFVRTIAFSPETEQFTFLESPGENLQPLSHQTTPLIDGRMLVTSNTFMGNTDGAYLYGKAIGGACSRAFECTSGYCVDGYCCNEACDDDGSCNTCAYARGASRNGMCTKLLDCMSYQCAYIEVLPDGQKSVCTTSCTHASDCATGHACTSQGLCEAPMPVDIDEGCAMLPGKTYSSAGGWLIVVGLGMSRIRRRTKKSPPRASTS